MNPDWEPANGTEVAMLNALTADDRQRYFQIIAAAPLYLPAFAADGHRSDGQQFVTHDLMGQTYLPVFTSVDGLAMAMRGVADSYTVTNYDELRSGWPSPDWRLAVNPGHPIDAWVAIEAVAEAAAGNLPVAAVTDFAVGSVPGDGSPTIETGAGSPDDDPAAVSDIMPDEQAGWLLSADVLVPTAEPVTDDRWVLHPDFPWRFGPGHTQPAVEVFTSAEALTAACPPGTPWVRASLVAVVAAWPEGDREFVVDARSPESFALTPAEVHTLLLTWAAEVEAGTTEDTDGVPAATYDQAPPATLGPDDDATESESLVHSALDQYLRALLSAEVLVPTDAAVTQADGVVREDFPWRFSADHAEPTIEVFTSLEGLTAAYPSGTPWVRASLVAVVAAWPDQARQLAVDPGSPAGFTLPATQVPALLLWAEDMQDPAEA